MHEFRLCPGARDDFPEVRHFHAHSDKIEFTAGGVLHPGVCNKNPQGGKIGAERHEERDCEVRSPGKTVPAEEEQPHHGGFEEERHQAFNREGGAEDVAYVM